MELINKNIYYNLNLYKIIKISKNFIYVNSLKSDNKIKLQIDSYDFYKKLPSFKDQTLIHYEDIIEEKQTFKIKKSEFNNYIIIDNIYNVYLHNNILKYDYVTACLVSRKVWRFETEFLLKYNISMLNNEEIKRKHKKWRESSLIEFEYTLIGFNFMASREYDINIIKDIGLYEQYLKLKEEAEAIYFKGKTILLNECCPVCLSSEDKNYKGFYNCSHHTCYNCYNEWRLKKNNCPICRASPAYSEYY